jgi:hypothetical protein
MRCAAIRRPRGSDPPAAQILYVVEVILDRLANDVGSAPRVAGRRAVTWIMGTPQDHGDVSDIIFGLQQIRLLRSGAARERLGDGYAIPQTAVRLPGIPAP